MAMGAKLARGLATSAILLSSLAGAAAAVSGPQLIDFEDLDPGPSQGIPVTDQYAEQGVVFEGATALDESERGLADGRVAIRTCWAKEFCDDPLVLHFQVPVSQVALRFGLDARLPADGTLILDAFDENGGRRGSADANLVEGSGPAPVREPLEVDDPEGGITDAVVHTENVPIGSILFDDIAFLPFEATAAAPQLVFSTTSGAPGERTLTILATVANVGDAPSAPSAIEVLAQGWPPASIALPGMAPGGELTVTGELPIPDFARGTVQQFSLRIDPDGISGDVDPSDNVVVTAVEIPPPGAPEVPTPEPSAAVEAPPVSGDGLTLVLLGGALVVVVGGSALVLRAVTGGGRATLSVSSKAELELKAEDADPPDTCSQDGSWYCKRSVAFDPRARRITALGATGARRGQRLSTSWPDELRERVLDAVRHADDPRRPEGARVADLAAELARAVPGSPGDPTERLRVAVQVTGSSVTGTLTPYRCQVGDDGTGTYRQVAREWKKTLTDRFDRTLAELDRFDGSPTSIEQLTTRLERGLRALAREL